MIEEQEIEQKRQELRDERNATREQSSKASGGALTNGGNPNSPARPTIQALRRVDTEIQPIGRETTGSNQGKPDSQRSTETESIGKRPGRRRLGSINTSSSDATETTRNRIATLGSIERVDGEFFRPDVSEKKQDSKLAEKVVKKLVDRLPSSSDDIPLFGSSSKSKVFSKKEAEEKYEPLMSAIEDYGEYFDMYMRKFEPDHPPTWGNFTPKELELVTKTWLRIAQRDARAAAVANLAIDGQDYIAVLVLLVPRIVATLKFTNRRIPRKVRGRENKH